MICKDVEEGAVPTEWRDTIKAIVEDIRKVELRSRWINENRYTVDLQDVDSIYRNVNAYREELAPLPNKTWQTSICRWMDGHWLVLVDLFTAPRQISDLVLTLDVYEDGTAYCFDVRSVHVP